jgi:TfoX/Sxy family transcriptional regulator of competence genes
LEWRKSSQELIDLFAELNGPFDCERKKMFGYPVCYVNGNMFCGLYEDRIILRLSDKEKEEALSKEELFGPFESMGKTMKQYVTIVNPLNLDRSFIASWLNRSFEYTKLLPPKEKKRSKNGTKI